MLASEKWKWSHSVVSDSSRPHGLQPTRLLRPWDFPGNSTGVGCHRLLWPTYWGATNPVPQLPWGIPLNPKVLVLVLQWFTLLLKFVLPQPVKGGFFLIEKRFPDQYILIDSQWFLPLIRQILGEYSEIRKRPGETCTAYIGNIECHWPIYSVKLLWTQLSSEDSTKEIQLFWDLFLIHFDLTLKSAK